MLQRPHLNNRIIASTVTLMLCAFLLGFHGGKNTALRQAQAQAQTQAQAQAQPETTIIDSSKTQPESTTQASTTQEPTQDSTTQNPTAQESTTTPATTDTLPTITDRADLPTTTEPAYDRDTRTVTYRYDSISKLPKTLPEDCEKLVFRVDVPCISDGGSVLLAEVTHPALNYTMTITIPEVERLTKAASEYGYGIVAVSIHKDNDDKDDVTGPLYTDFYVVNPEEYEDPEITVYFWEDSAGTKMPTQVARLGFYSKDKVGGYWQSSSASVDNFAFWGYGGGSYTGYKFTPYVLIMDPDDANPNKDLIADTIGYLEKYKEWWHEHNVEIFHILYRLNAAHTVFELKDYADQLGVTQLYTASDEQIYRRKDGRELRLINNEQGFTTVYVDDAIIYYDVGLLLRVNLPDEIKIEDSELALTPSQFNIVVNYMQGNFWKEQ